MPSLRAWGSGIIENTSGRRALESPGSDGMRAELEGQQTSQVLARAGNWERGQQHSWRQGVEETNVTKKCGRWESRGGRNKFKQVALLTGHSLHVPGPSPHKCRHHRSASGCSSLLEDKDSSGFLHERKKQTQQLAQTEWQRGRLQIL